MIDQYKWRPRKGKEGVSGLPFAWANILNKILFNSPSDVFNLENVKH
jgi:hypothetical protein